MIDGAPAIGSDERGAVQFMGKVGNNPDNRDAVLKPLRVLIAEDSQNDADLIIRELKRGGFDPKWKRIETASDMEDSLDSETWDLIISDFKMPNFNGLDALHLLQKKNLDIPFIISSGTIGEDTAVSIMKAGASDYIMKENLSRLSSAVERELRDAQGRRSRKIAEIDLNIANTWLKLALKAAKSGLWDWDMLTGKLFWSEELYELFGLNPESEASFDNWKRILHPDDLDIAMENINQAVKEKTYLENEYRIILPDGHFRWIGANGNAFYDETGRPLRMTGICLDITARKHAEMVSQENELRYRTLFENMQEGFAYCKMIYNDGKPQDFIYLDVNYKFELLTGLKNPIGKKITEVIPGIKESNPEIIETYGRVASTGKPEKLEIYLDALKTWFSVSLYCPQKDYFVAVFDNITERKNLEEALEKRIISLTKPLESTEDIRFEDLFNVDEIQKIQDSFANATGVASLIVDTKGNSITKPTNFCRLCNDIIRKTEKGRENCRRSDVIIGRKNINAPIVQPCLSGGLWDGGASICVGDRHIASWVVGQVMDDSIDQKKMVEYAKEIGADVQEFRKALKSVTRMSKEQFEKVCQFLFLIAGQLSRLALQNVQQARYITDRKKTEEALKASNAFNESLIQTIPFGFEIVDREGKILFLNEKMEKLIGCNGIGERCWRLYKDDKKQCADCPLAKDVNLGETKTIESSGVLGGKTYEITHTGMIYKGGKAILEIFNDISDRKKMEERIRQSEKMEAVGQLAGGIAHDFNNQLAGIMGYAEMLAARLDDKNLRDYAENIIRASKRSADLTRNLLSFARKGKYLEVSLNVHNIIEEVVTILEHSINKRIEIKRMLKASPATIRGDPTQIQNALLNLAINARDAMPDGGELAFTTENVSIEETPLKEHKHEVATGRCLKLCVSDNGHGMDKEVLKHIFEPFFTTKSVGKGTGMGLASVYGTVKSHHGFINVLSEVGKGSTFYLYFPLLEDVIELINKGSELEKQKKSINILVVDDEEMVRQLLSEIFKMLGHKVVTCKDGAEAVETYKKSHKDMDIVVLDMEMPKLSGKDTFFAMRTINPDVKVLLASGFSIEGEAQSLIEAGAKGFVQKPFNISDLSKSLNDVLRGE